MKKMDLIKVVARESELTLRDSEGVIDVIFASIVRALRSGDGVEIRGLGSFRTRQRQSRKNRNPKTGASVDVPAKRVPYFKLSKKLKDVVNGTTVVVGSSSTLPKG